VWLSKNYGIEIGMDTIDLVVESIAKRQARHPIREYLQSLKWDATIRIATMFERYFGAPASIYHAEIARMWMISAVARIMEPGCQADYMVVLEGPQGTRKSTAIKILAKGWSADTIVDIGRPDAMQALRGVWIYEVAELASIRSAKDIEKVKGFITSRVDHYRKSYGRRTEDFPRQCIFAGSTNDKFYLNDPTGNRRYWPVPCLDIDTEALAKDVDQLWAEAFARYQSGEAWYPQSREVVGMCAEEQAARTQHDPWLPLVEQWLNKDPVWFHVGGESDSWVCVVDGITTTDALIGAAKVPKDRIDRASETRMGRLLRECGMELQRFQNHGSRCRRYFWAAQHCPTVDNLPGPLPGHDQEPLFGDDL
jgi:putative DNA primase/helicase